MTRKIQSISQGDFFICVGRRQRYYVLAFLMMAGVDISDLEINYMPVTMSPDLPAHSADAERRLLSFQEGSNRGSTQGMGCGHWRLSYITKLVDTSTYSAVPTKRVRTKSSISKRSGKNSKPTLGACRFTLHILLGMGYERLT
jgi:hypothetical protein